MPRSNPARGAPPPPPPPQATPTPAAAAHPHHLHPHLHNPLDAPLAGHKRSERLLTWLVVAHILAALALAWRYWRRGWGEEGGELAGRRTRGGGGLRRVPSRGGGGGRVSAAYSFADLGSAEAGGATTTRGGSVAAPVVDGGSAEMVGIGMGARRVSRGALRRAG